MKLSPGIRQNLLTYAGLLALALVGIYYGRSLSSDFPSLRVWDFANLALMAIGIPFLFLQPASGMPDFWAPEVSRAQRIGYPLLIGAVFGILDVLIAGIWLHPAPYETLPPFLQPFPYSLFLYTSGAFEIEVFYRLIPLTLLLLIGKTYKAGQHYPVFVWVGILLTALREPVEQFPEGNVWFITYALISGFLMNALQAHYHTRSGFVASLMIRLGHYAFWHILYGIYVQFVQLA